MDYFQRGEFVPITNEFVSNGTYALNELSKFQQQFNLTDTDTTIGTLRDAIVADELGYSLINWGKHGFDAKHSTEDKFLEIKQCSITSKTWAGTWNDTTPEKATYFKDPRVYSVVAVWSSAINLEFMVYGQSPKLGDELERQMTNRKFAHTRSTQTITVKKMLLDFGFSLMSPRSKTVDMIHNLIYKLKPSLYNALNYSRESHI